jgi:hypothetical protein
MMTHASTTWSDSHNLGPVDLDCAWCDSSVPLPAGEFCGVCINCGMVMFRDSIRTARTAAAVAKHEYSEDPLPAKAG